MKKKLLVVLGAGSSIARGMPSVADLDQLMMRWARNWGTSHGFPNHYELLASEILTYYKSGPTGPRPVLNFEKVMGDMVALCHWMTPAPWGETLRQIACAGGAPPNLHFPNPSLHGHAPYGPTVMVKDQLQHLLMELARHMRGLCQKLNLMDSSAVSYRALFDGLRSGFDHAALVRHVYDADAILIGGYGFADVDINRALRNRLAITGERVPLMVLDYAGNKTDPLAFRYDPWAYELCGTLAAGGNFFLEPGHQSPSLPSELAAWGEFEVSKPHRVAVWYGGFGAAASRLDRILPWLDGQADSLLASRSRVPQN